jgi:hypothetical protein
LFIPQVKIIQDTSGSTILPRYEFTYSPYNASNDNVNYVFGDVVTRNNVAFKDVVLHLFGSDKSHEFLCNENGTTTYYTAVSGGLKWKNVLSTLASRISGLNQFDGLYGMLFTLSLNFKEANLLLYKNLQKEKERF